MTQCAQLPVREVPPHCKCTQSLTFLPTHILHVIIHNLGPNYYVVHVCVYVCVCVCVCVCACVCVCVCVCACHSYFYVIKLLMYS